jgi:outer membrane protein OmpA-like peptidoglycan-associated protein
MRLGKIAIVISGLGFVGCAAQVPNELERARTAYARVSNGPAAQWAPAEVHKALQALQAAEQSFTDNGDSYRTRDMAYVAERTSELSEAIAGTAQEAARRQRAEADFAKLQGRMVAQSRDLLNQTREREQKTQADLDAERRARAAAEQKAADADRRAKEASEQLAKLGMVREEPRGRVITLSGSVLFPSNSAMLLPEAQVRLGQVADALLATKEHNLSVEGYTDSRGSDEHNLMLSQQRADAVRSFLIGRGYEADRITARGYGKSKPIADNRGPEGRANNRRVEIVIENE